jgi:hypothetical protein
MKFAIPRSTSPSPERIRIHGTKARPGFSMRASDLDDSDDDVAEINDFAYNSNEEESDNDLSPDCYLQP